MKYFKLNEFTKSDTAVKYKIDNTPTDDVISNITNLVDNLLDKIREGWADYCKENKLGNAAIRINSGYRCPELNKKLGGVSTSAHITGNAADCYPMNGKIKEFYIFCQNFCKEYGLKWDQIINEYSKWVHIGYKNNNGLQRKQIFKL